ncbi:MAG: LD-carboxypeptidase [Cyclobacteriaceae bacterium]
MRRRKFFKSSALALGATSVFGTKAVALPRFNDSLPIIKPKKLEKGDTIGLITPASAVNRQSFEKAIENLEGFGFRVKYSENMRVKKGFLAGTDQQRLKDIHTMFEDGEVKGVVCARGGYGSGRLLPHIDYELIKSNPKVLVGYSDITALLFAVHAKTGLVCFHGPVGASEYSDFTTDQFKKVLLKGKGNVKVSRPKDWKQLEEKEFEPLVINDGIAAGSLVGGNLSLMVSVMGTSYDLSYKNKLVFIEDIGESPYRVDRMLTQLLNAGKLQESSGIALGVFNGCETKPDDPGYDQSLSLKEVLEDRLSSLKIPVVYGLPIGHIDDNATLPFGIEAELDTENVTLKILNNAVQ